MQVTSHTKKCGSQRSCPKENHKADAAEEKHVDFHVAAPAESVEGVARDRYGRMMKKSMAAPSTHRDSGDVNSSMSGIFFIATEFIDVCTGQVTVDVAENQGPEPLSRDVNDRAGVGSPSRLMRMSTLRVGG